MVSPSGRDVSTMSRSDVSCQHGHVSRDGVSRVACYTFVMTITCSCVTRPPDSQSINKYQTRSSFRLTLDILFLKHISVFTWAIPQYPGHLHREILIFSQKPLRTICIYHLVPFKLPKNVQRCPFQGLLVFKKNSKKSQILQNMS